MPRDIDGFFDLRKEESRAQLSSLHSVSGQADVRTDVPSKKRGAKRKLKHISSATRKASSIDHIDDMFGLGVARKPPKPLVELSHQPPHSAQSMLGVLKNITNTSGQPDKETCAPMFHADMRLVILPIMALCF